MFEKSSKQTDTLEKLCYTGFMYIHLGGELSLSEKLIIAILDFDACTRPGMMVNRALLETAEKEFRVESIAGSLPLSLVITLEKIYLSPLSTDTLKHRLQEI